MTESLTQAMVFFMVVAFVLSIVFSMLAHYQNKPLFKKIGYGFMVLLAFLIVGSLLAWFASI